MTEWEMGDAGQIRDEDRWWAALAYAFAPLSPVLILLMEDKKNRPFIQAHNLQALILGLINFALALLVGWVCLGALNVALLLYQFALAYRAYRGQFVSIPIITDFIRNQGWV